MVAMVTMVAMVAMVTMVAMVAMVTMVTCHSLTTQGLIVISFKKLTFAGWWYT